MISSQIHRANGPWRVRSRTNCSFAVFFVTSTRARGGPWDLLAKNGSLVDPANRQNRPVAHFGPIFMDFGSFLGWSKKHCFLASHQKVKDGRHNRPPHAPCPQGAPKSPPHPPGAGRVKLHGYHLEPYTEPVRNQILNQPTPSLNPSPAGPEIRTRADPGRHSH